MSILYIDYTHAIANKTGKVHGGGNYIRTFLLDVINSRVLEKNSLKVVLLWPSKHTDYSNVEKKIINYEEFNIKRIDESYDKIAFEEGASIFLPLLGVHEYPVIRKLKQRKLNIILTIHGVRNLDLVFDKYDLCYEIGIGNKTKCFMKEMLIPAKKIAYRFLIKKYLPYVDCAITVSNYTLSRLSEISRLNKVILQYENTMPILRQEKTSDELYILFVNGNRKEKNLARTIDAYKDYIDEGGHHKLFVVGTNDKVRKALIKNLVIKKLVDDEQIVFFDYVSDEYLALLFSGADFLVYTSKSEGFGLPALEAASYGCPTVAAYGTSIPEVLGADAIYVDPYSKASILNGLIQMSDRKQSDRIRSNLKKRLEISEYMAMKSTEMIQNYLFMHEGDEG